MAQVANCPQCEHELLVPDGTNSEAWARCPECRALFQLSAIESRELAALLPVDIDAEPASVLSSPTVADISSIATWTPDSTDEFETKSYDEIKLESETPAFEPAALKTPEDAAERIDAWFRSAKTVPDVPPLDSAASDDDEELTVEDDELVEKPADSSATGKTIDLSAHGLDVADFDDDFELEATADRPQDEATWDDSQHMERLLEGIDRDPVDEFVPTGRATAADDAEELHNESTAWASEAPPSITPRAGKPRRKRSLLRSLVLTMFGGVIGLGLGYYALLWMRGPEIDFLEVAQYLPKSILPPSFQPAPRPLAAVTPAPPAIAAAPAELVEETPATTDEMPEETPTAAPVEQQASFTEPAPLTTIDAPSEDVSASTPKATEEPAALDTPPATPLTEETKPAEAVQVAGAPTFTAEELSAALQTAKEACEKLAIGSLADGKEVQRAKGVSYAALADLAQKSTFVDAAASPEATTSQQEAEELFRTTLADERTRGEVAQITTKWIEFAKRPQNGIFFGGSVASHSDQGSVVECSVEMGGSQAMTVLVPIAAAQQLAGSSGPVGVAGWIVEKPAVSVPGYTGAATRAIFATRLISLE